MVDELLKSSDTPAEKSRPAGNSRCDWPENDTAAHPREAGHSGRGPCGVAVIGFSREADCLESAVRSAVADVQKAGCVVERV